MRKHLGAIFKIVFAAAILTWMARSDKLNFSQIAGALSHWPLLLLILGLLYGQLLITVWRWELLLRAQNLFIGIRQAFRLSLIGVLFNMVIPGAVGGDVMKAYYVTRGAPDRKAEAAGTIVFDRIIGLLALMLVAAGGAAWNLGFIQSNRSLTALCIFALLGALGGLAGLWLVVQFGPRLAARNPSGRIAAFCSQALAGFDGYRKRPATLPAAVLVSAVGHLMGCGGIYLCFPAIGSPVVPLRLFLVLVPVAVMTTAIPISPAGIGVGQVAFLTLFQMAAPQLAPAAVNAFTVFQSLALIMCLSGFPVYLTYKHVGRASRAGIGDGG